MASTQAVKLTKLVEEFNLEILNKGKTYERCQIRKDVINRPALQILGFFEYFDPTRLQLLGKVEWTYLSGQTPEERRKCFDDFFRKPIPALILSRGLEPYPELMEMAVKHQRTILRSKEATTTLLDNMTDEMMAEAVRRIGGRALTEASGGVRLERLRSIAATGVNFVSMGAITHSARAMDISLNIERD